MVSSRPRDPLQGLEITEGNHVLLYNSVYWVSSAKIYVSLPSNFTLAGSEFHTVGAASEKARVPAFVLPEECKEGYYWLSVAV